MAEYHYTIPATYLHFLREMGQNDGGLRKQKRWITDKAKS